MMISVISAVIAVLGAIATAALGYRAQAQRKSREHMDYMGRYRDALLWAAFDLQSRAYNILHGFEVDRLPGSGKGFLRAFLAEGTERQADHVKRSSAFVFAEYLGWVEIFRTDLQFLDLPRRSESPRRDHDRPGEQTRRAPVPRLRGILFHALIRRVSRRVVAADGFLLRYPVIRSLSRGRTPW